MRESDERIIEKDWKLYKLNLIVDRTATDLHHIIGQRYRNQYNVNAPENKVRISRRFHINYNNFVEDKQNPRDLFKIAYELTKQVLTPGVREILETVIYKTDDELFYIPEVLKNGKNKKQRKKNMQTWTPDTEL